MKGFGKGLALFFIMLAISGALLAILGGEEGSIQQGIAIAIGSIICYPIAVRLNAVKPLKVLCIVMGIMLVVSAVYSAAQGISFTPYLVSIFGVAVTFILVLLHRKA